MTRARRFRPGRQDVPYGGQKEWFQELWFPFDRIKEFHTKLDPGEPPPPPDPDEPPPPKPLPCTPEFDSRNLAHPWNRNPPLVYVAINNGAGQNGAGVYLNYDQCCSPGVLRSDGSVPGYNEFVVGFAAAFMPGNGAVHVTIEIAYDPTFGFNTWEVWKYNKATPNNYRDFTPDEVIGGSPSSVEWFAKDSAWVPGDGAQSFGTLFVVKPIIQRYYGWAIVKIDCP